MGTQVEFLASSNKNKSSELIGMAQPDCGINAYKLRTKVGL